MNDYFELMYRNPYTIAWKTERIFGIMSIWGGDNNVSRNSQSRLCV